MMDFAGEALIRKAGFNANGKLSLELQPVIEGQQMNFVWHPAPDNLQ